ncbi:MAG TPA: metallophosphoesterase [Candidatus Hydrogenedentes bacterium]|nr:metallophosphoesterase [Candidatus Hydrogenedentota bacterium]HPG69485.1 metallophosphoesterase [Candidatus Hydrogenedentota bacterium]
MATETVRDIVLHVTDLHFWKVVANPFRLANKRFLGNLNVLLSRGRQLVISRAEAFAEALAATGAGQILMTGDFSSTALDEEFEVAARFVRGLSERGLAVHLLPGNHDVYTFEAARARRFERHFAEFLPTGGYPARVDLIGGTPLILIPTVMPRAITARGRVTTEVVAEVKALIEACPATPTISAAHYPLLNRTSGYTSNPARRLANAEALRRVLGETGRPILHAAGHVHRSSYAQDADYATLEHLTTSAFFLERPGATVRGEFSEIHVLADGFRVFRHRFETDWTRSEAVKERL